MKKLNWHPSTERPPITYTRHNGTQACSNLHFIAVPEEQSIAMEPYVIDGYVYDTARQLNGEWDIYNPSSVAYWAEIPAVMQKEDVFFFDEGLNAQIQAAEMGKSDFWHLASKVLPGTTLKQDGLGFMALKSKPVFTLVQLKFTAPYEHTRWSFEVARLVDDKWEIPRIRKDLSFEVVYWAEITPVENRSGEKDMLRTIIKPAAQVRAETDHSELYKACESVTRAVTEASGRKQFRCVFDPRPVEQYHAVKAAFANLGYTFVPVGEIGGVRQDTEYICW